MHAYHSRAHRRNVCIRTAASRNDSLSLRPVSTAVKLITVVYPRVSNFSGNIALRISSVRGRLSSVSPLSYPVTPGPCVQSRCISRIWLSRARASRIRAGDERNSEFLVSERPTASSKSEREKWRASEIRGGELHAAWQKGITMPKRARIVVRPADNSQCAKCVEIEFWASIHSRAPFSAHFRVSWNICRNICPNLPRAVKQSALTRQVCRI